LIAFSIIFCNTYSNLSKEQHLINFIFMGKPSLKWPESPIAFQLAERINNSFPTLIKLRKVASIGMGRIAANPLSEDTTA